MLKTITLFSLISRLRNLFVSQGSVQTEISVSHKRKDVGLKYFMFHDMIADIFSSKKIQLVVTELFINPLSAKLTKWPNTLKQFVGNLPTNCFSVFGHFVNLALKGLRYLMKTTTSLSRGHFISNY